MSEKEKKSFKNKSKKFLSFPSFRRAKKLNQIKEDVCLDLKNEPSLDNSDKPSSDCGSNNSIKSLGLDATVSLDSPRKENVTDNDTETIDEFQSVCTPNSERRSFSNLRSAYHDNPDFVQNAFSPGARRLVLGGSRSLSTDSGIDCSILMSEKGSPERFQEFTRREAERIRLEHLQSLNNSLVSEEQPQNVENAFVGVNNHSLATVRVNETPASEGEASPNSLEVQIEQTKEHISLLSELRTVLEQKLEACNGCGVIASVDGGESIPDNDPAEDAISVDELNETENNVLTESLNNISQTDISEASTINCSDNSERSNMDYSGNSQRTLERTRIDFNIDYNLTESYNLLLHTNRTDERKSEEARLRLENASAFVDSLVIDSPSLIIDSPHLIVSPTPILSMASTANHRVLPSTPSPARLYVNEKSAFAKCKSLRRSVSDVGKGLLGKLRQKKKTGFEGKLENDMDKRDTGCSGEMNSTQTDNHRERLGDTSTFSAHLETSLLCDNSEIEVSDYDTPSFSWEISDLNASIESSYERDSIHSEQDISPNRMNDLSDFVNSERTNVEHSVNSISTIQELTTSICEMTSKLTLSPSQRSSANSIECMCNCKTRSDSPHICASSKPSSPFSQDIAYPNVRNIEQACETVKGNQVRDINSFETSVENEVAKDLGSGVSDWKNAEIEKHEGKQGENLLDNESESEPCETDTLLGNSKSDICNSGSTIERGINDRTRNSCAEIENSWCNCDTEDDSDDSTCSSCSGCSDELCSGRIREKRKLKFETDSSSGDTSPTDFNTGSSDKSSDSESESSSLEGTPEKSIWQDAIFEKGNLDNSPYSVSYMELNVDGLEPVYLKKKSNFERCYNLPICSPQSNFPSPQVNILNNTKTPASSPMVNSNDQPDEPANTSVSISPTQNLGGCRRKNTYVDMSPEHLRSRNHNSPLDLSVNGSMADTSFSRNCNYRRSESNLNVSYMSSVRGRGPRRTESDLNMSGLNLINCREGRKPESGLNITGLNVSRGNNQPDIIKNIQNSPVAPLDLSIRNESKKNSGTMRKKNAFWMDKHVGQVFSPAKIVLHKNRDISETDLCKNILDSYISDADESGFDHDLEGSFANSYNSSVNGSVFFNSSLNTSCTLNASLNSSSVLEGGSSDEDSVLQYGTYVAPRRPKKETNVDDFSTTEVSSCYSAQAKTRKLQGGNSGSNIHGVREENDVAGPIKSSHTRPVMSRSRTSHRGRPYNPAHYQSSRRKHPSQPAEETLDEIQERMRMTCEKEKGRVKGMSEIQRDTKDCSNVRQEIKESVDKDEEIEIKEKKVRVKGRRELREEGLNSFEVVGGSEVPEDTEKPERERVKGRRETRDFVLKDRTNTGRESSSQEQVKKVSEKDRSSSTSRQMIGKENLKILDISDNTFDQLTIKHTVHNGKRKVKCLSVYEAQTIVKHYPPPKQASSISWGQTLSEMDLSRHTPRKTPIKTKPILLPNKESYPYEEDTPSPIVLTRLRRSKSLSKKFKNWPW